ncbi:MAG: 4Fe-4S dicluster domain-containing protein [Armatimonadota bacterium]|nr:4Fe-4S dicluster domain-containing protein [Armatimonadota bacterium]MDR7463796.1 4Fe-4S dicluster domain-containing protein [Armatimonadota bacterium]MDR7469458.1 4Fe-4S dicluster domain-containing protein [Armatimonadota bacterium]MDR7473836.1 4Fe-4S dicluster domain-containing protein [Armatimonadota bacterium]MDR7539105.1 4Fe-4S dicluster domain-containing protein [Armatimonadota bacterium]
MKHIFVRLDRCTGCRECELACAVEHSASKELFTAIFETPPPKKRLYVESSDGRNIPILCRHCDDAPCLAACLSGAIYRDWDRQGVVTQRTDKCIGCWTCIMVCPYGVIGRRLDGGRWVAAKCDRCPDRAIPACVEACPTKALVYAEPEEWAAIARRTAATMLAGQEG